MMRHIYKHLGYFNEVGDVKELRTASADSIIDYYKKGYGAFHESNGHDADADICLEDEFANGKPFEDFMMDSSKEYIILNEAKTWEDWGERFKDNEDGDDAECYIDIYQLYKIEDNGYEFYRRDI